MNCLGGEYLVSVKKDMAAQLQFAKLYPYKTKVKKKKVLWKEKTKVETLGHTVHHYGKKQKQHISTNTSCDLLAQ